MYYVLCEVQGLRVWKRVRKGVRRMHIRTRQGSAVTRVEELQWVWRWRDFSTGAR